MDAREFQQAQYFDNILVSTIRFLDSLPAKTPNEKSQFLKGLPRILNQFPKSVLDKKILPALLEEMKDRELLTLILQNVFKIIAMLPAGKRAFTEKVIPKLRETFLSTPAPSAKGAAQERDSLKEAGLMVLLENMQIAAENSSGKEFKDDILPIINYALESPTHSLVDAALRTLPVVLPILDFSTVKNELFPVIASIFAKTSSMGIKIRGLEAFKTLCGGGGNEQDDFQGDGLTGIVAAPKTKSSNVSILDKYTIQEKIVPLLRGIKTKEPAVMVCLLLFLTNMSTYNTRRWLLSMFSRPSVTRSIATSWLLTFSPSCGNSAWGHYSIFHNFKLIWLLSNPCLRGSRTNIRVSSKNWAPTMRLQLRVMSL